MANLLRFKLTDIGGSILYLPDSVGWTLSIKETKESPSTDISALATGLATLSLEGYQDSVGFVRGIVITFKNKADSVWNTTMIGSMGFNLTGESGWVVIDSIRCYIYADALTVNGSLEWDIVPI